MDFLSHSGGSRILLVTSRYRTGDDIDFGLIAHLAYMQTLLLLLQVCFRYKT